MIALLTGQIAFKSIDHIIVDVGGVGYRVTIPLSTFYSLPEAGDVRLHIHTHVKEDAIQLYGFLTPGEKGMFALLIGVSGVGPKLAVNILSNIPESELRQALSEGAAKRLSGVPGIGKKTAERLILELQDKVKRLDKTGESPLAPACHPVDTSFDDTLSALVNLGYREKDARKALESIDIPPGTPVETILRGALKILVK